MWKKTFKTIDQLSCVVGHPVSKHVHGSIKLRVTIGTTSNTVIKTNEISLDIQW